MLFLLINMRLIQVVGLLKEMEEENPNSTYIPDNFFYNRFLVLVPDEEVRKKIIEICQLNNGTIPKKIEGLSTNGYPIGFLSDNI